MTPGFSRFLLKIMGWQCEGDKIQEKNAIFLEAPHTSIWDFAIGYLYYRSRNGHLKVMIKKEAFFFPFGCLLRALGGFPVDRNKPSQTILSIVHEMEASDSEPFHLAICPEGTRKAVHKWKTGYHTIARAVGLPVYVTYVDWGHKRVGIHCKVDLTDNARADTDRIQRIYGEMNLIAKYPKNFTTE